MKKELFTKEIEKQAEEMEPKGRSSKDVNFSKNQSEGSKVVVTEKELQVPQKVSKELLGLVEENVKKSEDSQDCTFIDDSSLPGKKFGVTLKTGPRRVNTSDNQVTHSNSFEKVKEQLLEKSPRGVRDFVEKQEPPRRPARRIYKKHTEACSKSKDKSRHTSRHDSGYYSGNNVLNWESGKKTHLSRTPTRKLDPQLKTKYKSEESLQVIYETLKKTLSISNLCRDYLDNQICQKDDPRESIVEATNCKLVTEMRRLSDADEILQRRQKDPTKDYVRISRVLLDQYNNPFMKTETIGVKDEDETIVEEVYPCKGPAKDPGGVGQGKMTKK